MKKILKKEVAAFTLIEMLMVLLIISVLILLFVPNLSKQKDKINESGQAAVVKVVESQADLFELTSGQGASLNKLLEAGNITQEQYKKYKEYYEKNPREAGKLPD
ncbi:competence type IV pilus major pilin ComGC [Streptococcaceae bacterium ESL0729]|nr:competence type IV pilus major pilin ComGC [Streptococcaceae bacterium ESL0729]